MRLNSWVIPLTGSLLLAFAYTLHADATLSKSPAKWGNRALPAADATSLPAPGPGGQVNGVVPPILTDEWMKLKVKCKGQLVDNFTGATSKKSVSFTAYMLLVAPTMGSLTSPGDGGAGFPAYDYIMWAENQEGAWTPLSYQGTLFTTGLDENGQSALVVNSFLGFELDIGQLASRQSATLKIKVDNVGALKSASYKTISSDMEQSVLPIGQDGSSYYGTMTISGSLVAVEKLPFNPDI